MRSSELGRWQQVAVACTAVAMLALLISLVVVGLREAVAISTVVMLFVAIATLLVAVLSLQPRETAARTKDKTDRPGEPPIRQISRPQIRALAAATFLLGVALCIFASDALLKYPASWPWWLAAAATFLGFAVASYGIGADVMRAAILSCNALWFFSYSALILEYRQSGSLGDLGRLATLSWIGAAANILFLALLAARGSRSGRVPASRPGWQHLLLCCLAFGMAFTAIALTGNSTVPWNLAGWIFTVALVADIALLRTPQSVALAGQGLGDPDE